MFRLERLLDEHRQEGRRNAVPHGVGHVEADVLLVQAEDVVDIAADEGGRAEDHAEACGADLRQLAGQEVPLEAGGEEAAVLRQRLLARMGNISEFMKTLKQRFSVWFNHTHQRYGTLWAERFKSVLVEGRGNALQTMAAYIDLNAVRAGLVSDPKDYRFCGYAEAVAGHARARRGLGVVWAHHAGGAGRPLAGARACAEEALACHREVLFGTRAGDAGLSETQRQAALRVLAANGTLPKATLLRCRVRYFTDGAILGSGDYVRGFVELWQAQRRRKHPPRVNALQGADWQGLACIQGLRRKVFE